MSFSESKHIELILNGTKKQTTRIERKRPIKEGDVLDCYYKSRMGTHSCRNCIVATCFYSPSRDQEDTANKLKLFSKREIIDNACWKNKFGKAKVTSVKPLCEVLNMYYWGDDEPCVPSDDGDIWAKKDGFKDFTEAARWFVSKYGEDWLTLPFIVTEFEPDWVKP